MPLWPSWLRHQFLKLEIAGSSPASGTKVSSSSGLGCQPVTLETAGSNPVETANGALANGIRQRAFNPQTKGSNPLRATNQYGTMNERA